MTAPENDGGPAFACANESAHQPGMSLRDWFAGQALAAIASDFGDTCEGYRTAISRRAYMLADAMLAQRGRP